MRSCRILIPFLMSLIIYWHFFAFFIISLNLLFNHKTPIFSFAILDIPKCARRSFVFARKALHYPIRDGELRWKKYTKHICEFTNIIHFIKKTLTWDLTPIRSFFYWGYTSLNRHEHVFVHTFRVLCTLFRFCAHYCEHLNGFISTFIYRVHGVHTF